MKSKVRESSIKRKLKLLVPFKLQKILYIFIKRIRLAKNLAKKSFKKEDLRKYLLSAGLKKGDAVIVHSSLGRIGFVENGANALIDVFLEVVTDEGTLVMPTFSALEYDKKSKMYIFDVRKTPAYTGRVPETFRLRHGVKRSISPAHSVAAYGKNADWIVKGHEDCDNPYSMQGPFGKLYKLNAKIFLIGVDQLANSSIHIVEDKCRFPIKVFTDKLKGVVIDNKGRKRLIEFRTHLSHLHSIRNNNIMEKYLLEDKIMKIYPFGNTELRVMRVKDFANCMERLLKKRVTIYNR